SRKRDRFQPLGISSSLVMSSKRHRVGLRCNSARQASKAVWSQRDGQKHNAPQPRDGIIIATVAASLLQAMEQRLIRDGVQKVADGGESGAIIESSPGEQGLRGVNVHGKKPQEKKIHLEDNRAMVPPGKSV